MKNKKGKKEKKDKAKKEKKPTKEDKSEEVKPAKKEKKPTKEDKSEEVKPAKVGGRHNGPVTEKEKAKMYKRLPADFKDNFLSKTKARTSKKNTFQCRGYDHFKTKDRDLAKAAYHKCGDFWDKANKK